MRNPAGGLRRLRAALVLAGLALPSAVTAQVGNSTSLAHGYARSMLETVAQDLKRNYYDSTFRGVDVDGELAQALAVIESSSAPTQSFQAIAGFLQAMQDSHTAFFPPLYSDAIDYGFELQFFGDKCYVSQVVPGTPAGDLLHVGDEVLRIESESPDRRTLSSWIYLNTVVAPVADIALRVRSPGSPERKVIVPATVEKGSTDSRDWRLRKRLSHEADSMSRALSHVYGEAADSVLVWRMKGFFEHDRNVSQLLEKATRYKVLVLDLRGNGGGSPETLKKLVGGLFDREVPVASLQMRSKVETIRARPGKKHFDGRLIVLVDSETGSAGEVFARVIQLEKRGIVIGDRTAGAVMQSRVRVHEVGAGQLWYYATAITDADVIMPDGGRLEGIGVVPDESVATTGKQLAEGADPVLARAFSLAGVEMDAVKAGGWDKR
jgi:C-terminal processing protease CtpA/Prc